MKHSAEQELLDYGTLMKENSRLSCQITLDEKLDGLIVYIQNRLDFFKSL